ncbi:MAG: histidine triad nucleotide-binding protein [Spirochaetia bacterium]|nr:histidine triad nucleotide-binding protein [Spirochaetia bacterium]
MENCIFCKIASKEIEAEIVHEGDGWIAFKDLNPIAPVHVLIVPKEHIVSIEKTDNTALLGKLLTAAAKTAHKLKLSENGYRVVNNIGVYGGQTVPHLHFHLLGGRQMGWPPG